MPDPDVNELSTFLGNPDTSTHPVEAERQYNAGSILGQRLRHRPTGWFVTPPTEFLSTFFSASPIEPRMKIY